MGETLTIFDDTIATGVRAAKLSLLWGETLTASAFVMHRRMRMICDAGASPSPADMAEFGRMLPEKTDAFYRAFSGASRARDPLEALENLVKPIHSRATGNARRLRGVR